MPSRISRARFGQSFGHWRRTFHPPPSKTYVTTTLGVFPVVRKPGRPSPSRSFAQPSNPISSAVLGARSASETRSSLSPGSITPGP
jgi:hypothetical protein